MPLPINIIRECIVEDAVTNDKLPLTNVPVECEYLGHVPGGMIAVNWYGRKIIVHPAATDIDKPRTNDHMPPTHPLDAMCETDSENSV